MPFITNATVSLPQIDATVTPEEVARAKAAIEAELTKEDVATTHPSIGDLLDALSSTTMEAEHKQFGDNKVKEGAIDLTRYESLDAPTKGDTTAWRTTLGGGYVSAEYMRSRESNLALLETYGKNAWLIGNSQLEDILRNLEQELDTAKTHSEALQQERNRAQENTMGEMQSLGETWRKGVGRMLETQAAAEGLRQEMRRRKHEPTM